MPCYEDIPDEENQIEKERRCKVRMYFDVQALMTDDQIKKSKELGINAFPLPDENSALCKLCSILTKEQMEKVTAFYFQIKWGHKTLYDWYLKHTEDDKKHNSDGWEIKNELINRLKELGILCDYTIDALLELMPAYIDIKKNEPFNNFYFNFLKRKSKDIQYIATYICDALKPGTEVLPNYFCRTYDESPTNCLAKMLIYLSENKLLSEEK